ncbi:MAG: hypothetical protein KBT31_04345, partial [Firmicutes bacterium]|nr:hypothetical protein [Candidatus Colimorpha enterica]
MRNKILKAVSVLLILIITVPVFASCGKKYDTVFEYNGYKITENQYYYWLSSYKRNILYSFTDAVNTKEFWGREYSDGQTYEDYFTSRICEQIQNYLIAEQLFKDLKLKLDDKVKASINEDFDEKISIAGGRRELNAELAEIMMSIDSLKDCYTAEKKLDAVTDYLFGDGGVLAPTGDDIIKYYNDNYYRIKYIVFYKEKLLTDENGDYLRDDEGNPLTEKMTDEELAAEYAKLEACEKEIEDGAQFNDCAKKYSEYDVSSYPNGFLFSANEIGVWGTAIFTATAAAEVNTLFRVDEDT